MHIYLFLNIIKLFILYNISILKKLANKAQFLKRKTEYTALALIILADGINGMSL